MKKLLAILVLLSVMNVAHAEVLLTLNNHVFRVKLAVSHEERRQGLMQRQSLAPDEGMLFVYTEPRIVSFWMKNTLIPLDILFFDQDGRLIQLFEHIQPCTTTPCKSYTNSEPAQYVLELPAGSAENISLTVGNSFEIAKQQ